MDRYWEMTAAEAIKPRLGFKVPRSKKKLSTEKENKKVYIIKTEYWYIYNLKFIDSGGEHYELSH